MRAGFLEKDITGQFYLYYKDHLPIIRRDDLFALQ